MTEYTGANPWPLVKTQMAVAKERPIAGPYVKQPPVAGESEFVPDAVERPAHYTSHKSGVECITITETMSFNLGNVVKYVWRADLKGDAVEDLRKAAWYIDREIKRRESSK